MLDYCLVNRDNLQICRSNNIFFFFSSDGITEKARLKKWGLLNFTKKPKSSVNLEKGTEGVTLSEDSISHVTQLIDYLSKEESKNV